MPPKEKKPAAEKPAEKPAETPAEKRAKKIVIKNGCSVLVDVE